MLILLEFAVRKLDMETSINTLAIGHSDAPAGESYRHEPSGQHVHLFHSFIVCATSGVVSRPALNADVLAAIVDQVFDRDARPLLLVGSRVLYRQTLLKLLRSVHLSNQKGVEKLLSVLNAGGFRYGAVRTVHLSFRHIESLHVLGQRLVETISRLENLGTVYLSYADITLSALPGLSSSLSNLLSIRSLWADKAGFLVCDMLKAMKSNVTALNMCFLLAAKDEEDTLYHRLDEDSYLAYHPVSLLSHFSESLKALHLNNCHTSLHGNNLNDSLLSYRHVYPKMRVLHIQDARRRLNNGHFPRTLPYVRAFPCLTWLEMETKHKFMLNEGTFTHRDLDEHRALNISDQSRNGCFWRHLFQFTGFLADLYAFAPVGAIPYIHITSGVRRLADLRMLAACMESARPIHLKLRGNHRLLNSEIVPAGMPGCLADVLRGPGARRIKSLVLNISLTTENWVDGDILLQDVDIAHALVRIPTVIPTTANPAFSS